MKPTYTRQILTSILIVVCGIAYMIVMAVGGTLNLYFAIGGAVIIVSGLWTLRDWLRLRNVRREN